MGKYISDKYGLKVAAALMAAAALWFIMFSPWTAPHVNFWAAMSCSAAILMTLAAAS